MTRNVVRACFQLGLALCAVFVTGQDLAAAARAQSPHAKRASAALPPLTLVVVLDQFPSWMLDMHLGQLDASGAIRTTMRQGATHRRVVYDFATTYTSPGHAAIFTGAPPAHSGIDCNRVWNASTGKRRATVEDGVHAVFGAAGKTAGPKYLRSEGVADVLKQANPSSRVVALSLKDRGAVIPGGQRPDVALWYDSKARGFTTSSYYASALPAWLVKWQTAQPANRWFVEWPALDASRWSLVVGPDAAPGEQNRSGFGVVFPHHVTKSADPYAAIIYTPMSTEWLLELASQSIEHEQLCTDAAPDLLSISVSSTDYVGHAFGAHSWEALDHLVRIDAALGEFTRKLQARCSLSVLITSDHGGAPMPEVSARQGRAAHRLYASELLQQAESALDSALGQGTWLSGVSDAFFHFTPAARAPSIRPRALRVVQQALASVPGVHGVYDVQQAKGWVRDADPLKRSLALGIASDSAADFWVVPKPYSILLDSREDGGGTTHGTPWHYDTNVPVLVSGPGVASLETREPLRQCRVASTIASLLRVRAPKHACGEPLPGAPTPVNE